MPAALFSFASSERSGVVTSEQVQDLTIVSRDFSVLASLQPGVVYNGAAETQSFSQSARYNVNGGRTTQNNITVDGIPIENSNVGSTNTFVSLDAISEVKVLTSNFQAEFGRKPAGAIADCRFQIADWKSVLLSFCNLKSAICNRKEHAPTGPRVATAGPRRRGDAPGSHDPHGRCRSQAQDWYC